MSCEGHQRHSIFLVLCANSLELSLPIRLGLTIWPKTNFYVDYWKVGNINIEISSVLLEGPEA